MQLFRFAAAVVLIVLVSLIGIAQEKRRLALSRAISLQQYRTDQLMERRAHLRLQVHELTSPVNKPATGHAKRFDDPNLTSRVR